jgi:LmbE family N-acetylglucosaminyl deacetylase
MRVDFADDRMLAVVAHPDDAELLCAGTLARARSDGAEIAICVLCQGDKGQPREPIANLAQVRRSEMTAAAEILGAELFFADVPDGRLQDDAETRRQLIETYRRFTPTLILAHWRDDYHADHRAGGALAEAASWFCCSTGHQTESPAMPGPPALWWMDTVDMAGFEPHFYFDVTGLVDVKRKMLACHASQLARGEHGDFSPLADLMLRQCKARGAQAGVDAAEAFRAHTAWKRIRAW